MARKRDLRTTRRYEVVRDAIVAIQRFGPMTLEEICNALQISPFDFRVARYSLAGKLALEDQGVVIPRPIFAEGYVYKVADPADWATLTDGDPELNTATSFTDLLTRVAVVYQDVSDMADQISGRTATGRLLRRLRRCMDLGLDEAEAVVNIVGGDVGDRAQYILDNRP